MVYEFTATGDTKYFFGLHLVSSDDYRYVLNAHGDVIALVSKTGSTVAKYYEYDAFGNEINPDSSDTNPYRYCGEYYNFESGTVYLRARYYSPTHGRFTQVDTARDGLNWYAYCGNNPIAFVDSSGLTKTVVSGGVYADDSHGGYKYNFIESALHDIYELSRNYDEQIDWCIANEGWSDVDLSNFASAVNGMNVKNARMVMFP